MLGPFEGTFISWREGSVVDSTIALFVGPCVGFSVNLRDGSGDGTLLQR